MKYDSKQISIELEQLNKEKEIALEQYYNICGAIKVLERMHSNIIFYEQERETI
jgi:hypothetical protein